MAVRILGQFLGNKLAKNILGKLLFWDEYPTNFYPPTNKYFYLF
jgi:hypothetical protein